MGRVWLAYDQVLHRDVAVKEVIPPPWLTEAERDQASARSLREARAIARLSHPDVVRIYDVVTKEQWPWIVMEYVASRSLHQVIEEDGPLPPAEVARIGLGILGALRAAHSAGILHRDVKPANVLLAEGRAVLTDFGLATVEGEATVTRSGMIIGSPAYISPERARGGTAGPASDLWSLGATLYAAVEGQAPFARTNAIATLTALVTEEPDEPTRAGALRPVLEGLLRKDPDDRIGAAEAERMLRRAVGRAAPRLPVRAWRAPRPRPTVPAPVPVPVTQPPPATEDAAPEQVTPEQPTEVHTARAAAAPGEDSGTGETRQAIPVLAAPSPEASPAATAVPPTAVPPTVVQPTAVPPTAVPPTAGQPTAAEVRRRWLLIGAALFVLLLVAVVAIVMSNRGSDRAGPGPTRSQAATGSAPAARPSPSPSAASNPSPTAAPGGDAGTPILPAGWHFYSDRSGFTVAVPDGWAVSQRNGMVYFQEPGGGRLLGIDQTDQPKSDPVADWTSQSQWRVDHGEFPGYQRIKIVSVPYHVKAADWEFTYDNKGVPTHVINRGAVFGPHQAYGFYWSTPDTQWQDSLAYFDTITSTFQGRS
jgi:hypothetical protein